MEESGARTVAERAAIPLARCLGPHTARVAVKTFAQRALGLSEQALTVADVPALAQALKPMLRTMLGKHRGEIVVQQIMREFGL